MKLHSGLLLLCLALAVSSRAEEVMPVKTEAAKAKQELVWPEIKDPQAVLDFAKAEIAKLTASGKDSDSLALSGITEFAYLHLLPFECGVYPEYVLLALETHPHTGQAFLIIPDLTLKRLTIHPKILPTVTDTRTTEIKQILMPLTASPRSEMKSLEYNTLSVSWHNIQNLDADRNTWPRPIDMRLPAYPYEMIRIGYVGEAKVEFAITAEGLVSLRRVEATSNEFEAAVREVAQLWRFEPGVDLKTRLPMDTRISLAVKFDLKENY